MGPGAPLPAPSEGLLRAMGTWALAASIVNVTIGGGIFGLPASAASVLGAAAPLAYVTAAIAMALIVLCFAEAGSRVSMTGGPYAYVEVAFGPLVGFVTGVLLWAGISLALAAVSALFVDSLGALVPAVAAPVSRAVVLVVALALLAALNVRGIQGASRFNVLMTVAKLVPLAVLVVGGMAAVRGANLEWHGAPPGRALAQGSAILMFAFMGVESALVPSGEVREPARTVPRAIAIAMILVAVVYLAVQLVTQGVLGAALAGEKAPLAAAARVALGGWGWTLILVGSTISMLGYVSGMTLAVPRMLFAFARDGFLPAALARVHPRFRTPAPAIVAQTAITAALALWGGFAYLAVLAVITVLLAYAACCAAAWELRRRNVRQAGGVPFDIPLAGVVPILALAVIAWLLSSLSSREWIAAGIVIAIALAMYAGARGGLRGAGGHPVIPQERP